MSIKISAAIITHNEERNIARVIESLRCCDEILVLDSGSNDRTVEVATNLGARVIEASWHGYAAQKNIAAELAANDWILALDADESLSEASRGRNLAHQEIWAGVRWLHGSPLSAVSRPLDSSQRLASRSQGAPLRPAQG